MARKQKRSAPRKFRGVRLIPAVEALTQMAIWTDAALNVNPFQFISGVTGGKYQPGRDGGSVITLPEIITGFAGGSYADTLPEAIVKNIGGINGLVKTGLKSAGVAIGFRIFGKLTRKARSGINAQILKPFGMNEFIRF